MCGGVRRRDGREVSPTLNDSHVALQPVSEDRGNGEVT